MVKVQTIGRTFVISIPRDLCLLEGIKKGDRLHFNRPSKGRLELVKL